MRKGHPMRLELTCVGLLVELANHYTTRDACVIRNNGSVVEFRHCNLWSLVRFPVMEITVYTTDEVETAVQYSRISCVGVRRICWS